MTTTQILIMAASIASLLVVVGSVLVFLSLLWAAKGSPDVNGDPERDAGYDADDIRAMSQHWDHGSYRTHRRPDLETARQLNRCRLGRDAAELRSINHNLRRI